MIDNRIPYGLLTKEEKKEFDIAGKRLGMYDRYNPESDSWELDVTFGQFKADKIYRLKEIMCDEWILYRKDCMDKPEGELRDLQYYHDHDRVWRRTNEIGYEWLYRYKAGTPNEPS